MFPSNFWFPSFFHFFISLNFHFKFPRVPLFSFPQFSLLVPFYFHFNSPQFPLTHAVSPCSKASMNQCTENCSLNWKGNADDKNRRDTKIYFVWLATANWPNACYDLKCPTQDYPHNRNSSGVKIYWSHFLKDQRIQQNNNRKNSHLYFL